MTVRIDLRQYPGWLARKADQFPFAAMQALNDSAFKLKRELDDRGLDDLNFKRPHKAALGITVHKASKTDLEARVFSTRGWLETQIQEGVTRPIRGIDYQGRKYLLIPKDGSRKNRKGRLVGITARAKLFIVNSGGTLVMLARFSKKRVERVGILVPEAQFADDFGWLDESQEVIDRYIADRFAFRLARAMRTAR